VTIIILMNKSTKDPNDAARAFEAANSQN